MCCPGAFICHSIQHLFDMLTLYVIYSEGRKCQFALMRNTTQRRRAMSHRKRRSRILHLSMKTTIAIATIYLINTPHANDSKLAKSALRVPPPAPG